MIGNRLHHLGRTVILSRSVIEHYIGNDSIRASWSHRLRWARGSRRSRPAGYVGEVFTKPTVPAVALLVLAPGWGAVAGLAVAALVMRLAVVWTASSLVLEDREMKRRWWLLPMEDISTFTVWALGFFGNKLVWRGHELIIQRDGTVLTPEPATSSALQ